MAHHSRSNSLPSKSHPTIEDCENHLHRLRGSEASSSSASSVCTNLNSLNDLQESINNLIELPSIQQALALEQSKSWALEFVDGSLRLLDSCGIAKDIIAVMKESVQDLESSVRRSRGEADIATYMASRKKVYKMIKKCIKNMKVSKEFSARAVLEMDQDLTTITGTLREAEATGFSVLKSVLILISGEKEKSKQRNWSALSKFTNTGRVHSECGAEDLYSLNIHKSRKGMENISLKHLKASEMSIQKIEEELEALFRSLVKTRVSLLNVLSH